jgi:pimeloyl-ACP methyl ester carboxylesterase
VEGPILLVGHNYGGAVISVAGAATDQAVGLVFVAAFIPDVGDTVAGILARSCAPAAHRTRPYACRPHTTDSAATASTDDRAVSQPIRASIFGDPAWAAAWHELPSWAIVATEDPAIAVELQRAMARKAGARVVELDGAHAIAVTHPKLVASMIVRALGATATERLVGASRAAAD